MNRALRTIRSLVSVSALAATGLTATQALATPAISIDLNSITLEGPGCPQGSVHAQVFDGTRVQFLFDELLARAGISQGSPLFDQKNCWVKVNVAVPAGYRVAPGPVSVDATVTGVSETGSASVYARYFIDDKASHFASKSLSAANFPASGDPVELKLKSADASINPDAWSGSCGGTHELRLQARAIARSGQHDVGFTEVFVDRSNNSLQHKIACQVVLKPCGAP